MEINLTSIPTTTSSPAVDAIKHKKIRRFYWFYFKIWRDNWNNLNTDVTERKADLTKYKVID